MVKPFTNMNKIVILLLISVLPASAFSQIEPPPGCMVIGERALHADHYYDGDHACHSCVNQQAGHCDGLNKVVAPNMAVAEDLIIIPHRGVWGFPKSRGAPENTFAAVQCAKQYDLDVVEIDVMRTADGKAVLSHYFPLTWAGLPGQTTDKTLAELTQIKVKMRNEEIHPTETFASLDQVVNYAWSNGILLVVDIKVDGATTSQKITNFVQTVKAMFDSVDVNKLGSMAVKVPAWGHNEFMTELNLQVPNYQSAYQGKFQWILISNKAIDDSDMTTVLNRIKNWIDQEGMNLAFVETIIFSPDWWGGKPFTWAGQTYKNLIDYVNVYSASIAVRPVSMRASVWSLDAMGQRGTFTRHYQWRHFGNFSNDIRGDIPTTMAYFGMPHSMITTDRFDVFKQYLQNDWHPSGEVTEVVCNPSN